MSDSLSPTTNQRLRIGFIHRFDARNIRSWSGIFFFMSRALETHVGEVVYLGPDDSPGTRFIVDNIARANRVWQWIFGKSLATDHNRFLSSRLGRFFEQRLHDSPCDILFAPVASVEIANIRTDLPIIYYSDLTWNQILEYYPDYSCISSFGKAQGERIESSAILRSKAAVYPSEWAVDSACNHYGASRQTTLKASFGANLNDPPSREAALQHPLGDTIKLLLVGVDWHRKGGAIALECLTSLLEGGVDAELTILGCKPPAGVDHPKMVVIPFLSKHDPEQRKQIAKLFLEANFMLLPTRADATPIVISEASAFGLPTLASDTGGLRGSITEGANGYLFPIEARGSVYADKIIDLIAVPGDYRKLVHSSRQAFETTLNWDAWGRTMREIFEMVLERKIAPGSSNHSTLDGMEQGPSSLIRADSGTESSASLTQEVSHI
jgi:glycosyltransferase involved in cell wall biosynthesis